MVERTGMPLDDDVLEELAASFPGLYPEDDAEPYFDQSARRAAAGRTRSGRSPVHRRASASGYQSV